MSLSTLPSRSLSDIAEGTCATVRVELDSGARTMTCTHRGLIDLQTGGAFTAETPAEREELVAALEAKAAELERTPDAFFVPGLNRAEAAALRRFASLL